MVLLRYLDLKLKLKCQGLLYFSAQFAIIIQHTSIPNWQVQYKFVLVPDELRSNC